MNEIAIQHAVTPMASVESQGAARGHAQAPARCPRCASLALRQVSMPPCPAERWQAGTEGAA